MSQRLSLSPGLLSGLLFLFSFFIWITQIPKTATVEGDAAEIISAIQTLGVIHSPGFPTYMTFTILFSKIFFFLDAPVVGALLSVIFGSLCIVLVFQILLYYKTHLWLAFVLSLLPAFSFEFWYQTLIAETYSFAVFWMLLITFQFLRLRQVPNTFQLSFFIFLLTAGLGVHVYVWPLVPLGFIYALSTWKSWNMRTIGFICLAGLLGLAFFAYIPLLAGHSSYVNEGNVTTLSRFIDHVTWKLHRERLVEYESQMQGNLWEWIHVKARQWVYFLKEILQQWSPWLILPILFLSIGSFFQQGKTKKNVRIFPDTKWFGFLALGLFLNIWIIFAGSTYMPSVLSEMKVHFVPVYFFFIIWLGLSLQKFVNWQGKLAFGFGILLLLHIFIHFKDYNISSNTLVESHAGDILTLLPKNSILMSQGDTDLMSITYLQAVKRTREDVQLVNLANGTEWYFDQLTKNKKSMEMPSQYSKYFQLEILEKNYGKKPIFFSNYYAALLILKFVDMKNKFIVVPELGSYRLLKKEDFDENQVSKMVIQFSANTHPSYKMRDAEKDIFGNYKDYHLRRAQFLSKQNPKLAQAEIDLGLKIPIYDSQFNQIMHNELLKVQQSLSIRN
ncbi:MAG: DUF2723 domain-containing protein [Bdellovibrionales bacterium]|nr:DUF2723 domain-containing protein [Bdellovibrionales bacterium]